jgi:hypothetical protein
MSTVRKMSNVAIAMQSALGAVKTITAVSIAAPGVVTATHDFINGDFVLLSVQGMSQLDGRVFRVCNVSTTVSFQLEDISGGTGISTVGYDVFVSGTANKITFGTSITTSTTLDASGGEFGYLDTTLVHSNVKSQIPGVAEPLAFAMELLWDITDTAQKAMLVASNAQTQLAFKITYGTSGPIQTFTGYVGFTGSPKGAAQEVLKSSATITAFGKPTYYSA